MGTFIDDLTWTCHVCGDERPDRFISVHKSLYRMNGIPVQENIRFCNDRPACLAAAPFTTHFKQRKDMPDSNGKYVTFKADEFRDWYQTVESKGGTVPMAVDDAVVIRRQDAFAAPALQTYASSIALTARLLSDNGQELAAKRLRGIADYFNEQAEIAMQDGGKLPD